MHFVTDFDYFLESIFRSRLYASHVKMHQIIRALKGVAHVTKVPWESFELNDEKTCQTLLSGNKNKHLDLFYSDL